MTRQNMTKEEHEKRYKEARARYEKMLENEPKLTQEQISKAISKANPKMLEIYRKQGWSDEAIAERIYAY